MRSESAVLAGYHPYTSDPELDFSEIGTFSHPIPRFRYELLHDLCVRCAQHFAEQPTIIHLEGTIEIVGDIHGNLHDLLRILAHVGSPSTHRYVFLGDYVDRGHYSVEVVTLLFALVLLYPDNVFLIRGNHEFRAVNATYGFKAEIEERYKDTNLFEDVNRAFDNLPLGVVVSDKFLCVHGGLPKAITKLEELERLNRFSEDETTKSIVTDLVWSDPRDDVQLFQPSLRGRGNFFGELVLHQFLKNSKLSTMVRGHECVPMGASMVMHKRVLTVFSSSNYTENRNKAGVGHIEAGDLMAYCIPPITLTVAVGEESYRDIDVQRTHTKKYESLRQTRALKALPVGKIGQMNLKTPLGKSCSSFPIRRMVSHDKIPLVKGHSSVDRMPQLTKSQQWDTPITASQLVLV